MPRLAVPPLHRAEVPEHWKAPQGPFHQAPPEYGGEWWKVDPFIGDRPWERWANPEIPDPELPEGWPFGPRPKRVMWPTIDQSALEDLGLEWDSKLKRFDAIIKSPDDFASERIAEAAAFYEKWNMGRMVIYCNRDGSRWAYFPQLLEREAQFYEAPLYSALMACVIVLVWRQLRAIGDGIDPGELHPETLKVGT